MVNRIYGTYQPLEAIKSPASKAPARPDGEFKAALGAEVSRIREIKFSAHAAERLQSRKIGMTEGDAATLSEGVDRAAGKGARNALVVMKGAGFIVNVPSRTVVTAVDTSELGAKVFTNIDSAVVMPG